MMGTKRKGKFVVYLDAAGEYRWRKVASNGRTVADSGEGYVHRRDCLNAIVAMDETLTIDFDEQS